MKVTPIFKLVAVSSMSLTLSSLGQNYEYQYTAPINGSIQLGGFDPGSGGKGNGLGFSFGTLFETVYYNPTANTLQQVGSITFYSTISSSGFEDDKGTEDSPILANISLSCILNGGSNTINFDTGIQSAANAYLPNDVYLGVNPSIPFAESITVTTGGQNYDSVISGIIDAPALTYISDISPDSLVIQQGNPYQVGGFPNQSSGLITASDGWSGNIVDVAPGAPNTYTFYVDPMTIYEVPEPSTSMMLSLGAFGLMSILRRRVH